MLSFFIRAHNEEVLLDQTLPALFQAIARIGDRAEAIVVDDASTDRTADVARSHGARVLSISLRRIARRDAFEAAGGFHETFFAAEDIDLSRRLKREQRPSTGDSPPKAV